MQVPTQNVGVYSSAMQRFKSHGNGRFTCVTVDGLQLYQTKSHVVANTQFPRWKCARRHVCVCVCVPVVPEVLQEYVDSGRFSVQGISKGKYAVLLTNSFLLTPVLHSSVVAVVWCVVFFRRRRSS